MSVSLEATHDDVRLALEEPSGGIIVVVVSASVHYIYPGSVEDVSLNSLREREES